MLKKLSKIKSKFSPNLYKFVGNTAWLLADKMLRMGVGLFVGLWVARYLGPEKFGIYNYAIAFVSMLTPLSTLGLEQISIRNIIRDPQEKNQVLGTAFVLKFIGGLVTLTLTICGIGLLRPGDISIRSLVGLIAIGTLFQAFDTIDFFFQSQQQSKYTVFARGTAFALSSIGKIVLIQIQAPLIMFAGIWSIELGFGAVGLVFAYHLQGHIIRNWRYNFNYAKKLLKDSWTLIFSSIVIMIYMRLDQIMLGQMIGDQEVGIYSAAVKISELWYFIPISIANSAFPAILEGKKISEKIYYQRLEKLLGLMSLLSYAVALPLCFISKDIVALLYGPGYEEAGLILTTHIWTGIFVSSGLVRSLWTTTEGFMKFALASTTIGAVINVVLNYFFIKTYHGLGAAIATVIAQFFASYASNLFFKPTRKIFIYQTKSLLLIPLIKLIKLKFT
ncbi:flippase [Anabaena sp. UHCC 0187]|uniref:flippase n=1 Tax=Anabaena sp. UHCC 0187 TaxID=2590018 RepID=UPI00144745DD|nr:flippase [Anabaena sp. UHCC 0187]MTJ14888.1 flippase [Anabaena sp. UHCC 0187]